MNQSVPPNIRQLLTTAHAEGDLSKRSLVLLSDVDVGAKIQAGIGVNVDDVPASEVVLVTQMIDDSGSIRFASNAQTVRDGHNVVLTSLRESKQRSNILAMTRYLNGRVLFPYGSLDQTIDLDASNYDPNLGTPLYDATIELLGTVLVKTRAFAENGVAVRTVTLIVSDGADEHSTRATAADCKDIATKLLLTERHIIAAMGIDDGGRTNFREVFRSMGIRDEWVLTTSNTKSEIRRSFLLFSQSAVRASQSAAQFSATALGGFGAP